jgi:branched-chain amino acid transport system substrate-binding protein
MTSTNLLRRLATASGAAVLLSLAAMTGQAADKPILIGATSSETGPLAADAEYNLNGMKLAVEEVNAKGGWLGRKLELKVYDDESKPGTAVRLYTRLITEDKADLLIGPYSSGITQAVAPLFSKRQYAVIEPEASIPTIYVPGNKWNFQGVASSLDYLEGLLPLASKSGAKTVAVLGLKSAFTLACYDARIKQAEKLGMKVVYKTTYSLPEPDFASMALAIKNAHPDVVLGCTYYPDAVGLVKAFHAQGYAPKYFAETVGPVAAAYVKALGPLANRIISNTGWWSSFKTPGNKEFVEHYKSMFKQDPDYHAAAGYGAVKVLGAAVEGTKSLDQDKIREWLHKNTVDTVQGPFKVDANGLAQGFSQSLVQIQDGHLKLITPEDMAEAKLLAPYTGQ